LQKPDKATVATMVAGMCTFLHVYCTQPLLPLLRDTFMPRVAVSFTVSATIFATALTRPSSHESPTARTQEGHRTSLFLLAIPPAGGDFD